MSAPDAAVTATTQRRTPWWVFLMRQLIALALILPVVYAAIMLLAPLPQTHAHESSVAAGAGAPAVIAAGDVLASGFWVEDLEGAHAVYGSEAQMPMASIAKLIPVLAVLDAFPIEGEDRGAIITIGEADLEFFRLASLDEAFAVPLQLGATVTQRDLIEWSLVASSSNSIMTLGAWAFGSVDGAIAASNEWLARHNLASTVVADLAGLDYGSVSTAADLVQLGRLALDNPVVAASVALPSITAPIHGIVPNTNRMLGDPGVTGIKTGTLFDFGRNLLFSATQEIGGTRYRVVGVIVGAVSVDVQYESARGLLASVWPNIQQVEVLTAGTVVGEYTTPWGDSAEAVAADGVTAWVWGEGSATITVALDDIETALTGATVGEITVTVNGASTAVDAVLRGTIDGPDPWWRLTHPTEIGPLAGL